MSVRNLKSLLRPRSVAVIGATVTERTTGWVAMRNLLDGGFSGPVMPVCAGHQSVAGVLAYPDVASLPVAPDLALICSDLGDLPGLLRGLGERGTRSACVMTDQDHLSTEAWAEAKTFGIRLLGPGSTGLLVPGIGLNASFAPHGAKAGRVAFVSQSGAVCSAVLDWAGAKGIGFSHVVDIGDGRDVGFGDMLDYLGSDPTARAILLHIETIGAKRDFMSAARAAARNKPVLAIKTGRDSVLCDRVFDAAIRRAGMLRVRDIEEIFGAVETLSRARPMKGRRLAIVTNGDGIGRIAADDLAEGGGRLAALTANPVDLGPDADGAAYAKALESLFDDKHQVDAVLAMYAPTGLSDPMDVAQAVITVFKERSRANLMSCWVGNVTVGPARAALAEAGVPVFETPRAAIEGFLHVLEYRRNQDMLMETPPAAPSDFVPDTRAAHRIVQNAMAAGRLTLTEPEARAILEDYGIPVIETRIAKTPAEAGEIAAQMGGSVALKILSPDIVVKSDVGGVALNLSGAPDVEGVATRMLGRVTAGAPSARLDGFIVQRMAVRSPGTQELTVGVVTDPVFGPVVLFGQGGVGAELIDDQAVALPPLNMRLAADLVERTRIAKLLAGYGDRPPADTEALTLALIQVSQMVVDLPELHTMEINPLRCNASGILALDVKITLAPPPPVGQRMAIRPYPSRLEEWFTTKDGRSVLLRPIRPEDEPNHHVFISRLTSEDIRFRFFGLVHELPHSEMARLTQIDYDREMAFVAEHMDPAGGSETYGVVRTVTDPDNEKAEFAIVVRSDLKGTGLGRRLLTKMIDYCRSRGTKAIVGQILKDNVRMIQFVEGLGFKPVRSLEDDIVEVELELG